MKAVKQLSTALLLVWILWSQVSTSQGDTWAPEHEFPTQTVRGALTNYRCEVLACVTEGDKAFAKMRFSGLHVAPFRGYPATGKPVHWLGAALFRFERHAIAELWVLGDLAGLD